MVRSTKEEYLPVAMSFHEIGEELGISASRAAKICRDALRKLTRSEYKRLVVIAELQAGLDNRRQYAEPTRRGRCA